MPSVKCKTLDDLIYAAVQEGFQGWEEELERILYRHPTTAQRLNAVFHRVIAWVERHPELNWIWLMEGLRRMRSSERARSPLREILRRIFAAGQQSGEIPTLRSPEELALDLMATSQRFGPLSMLANTSSGVWHDGLEKLLAKVTPEEAQALVQDRKAQREAWLAESPPDVIMEDGNTPEALHSTPGTERPGESARALRGTGVPAGRATGRVRILRHPSEGDRLGKGEILVAPSTDPGWTPLFMRAAAIAMEVGGYHSHGAIVAREFGIPAVANIPGLLAALKEGEEVTVDGDKGKILRH